MAGKCNQLGRVYEPGKALSEPLREEIIEMYNEGFSLTDIPNDLKVTFRGVNKIINHYAHHGTLIPFCHGGSEADVVTDLLKYGSFRGLEFMQEKYRTDFCFKGYVTEINFHQYRQFTGVSTEN